MKRIMYLLMLTFCGMAYADPGITIEVDVFIDPPAGSGGTPTIGNK